MTEIALSTLIVQLLKCAEHPQVRPCFTMRGGQLSVSCVKWTQLKTSGRLQCQLCIDLSKESPLTHQL